MATVQQWNQEAFELLSALQQAVQWELAPAIMNRIAALVKAHACMLEQLISKAPAQPAREAQTACAEEISELKMANWAHLSNPLQIEMVKHGNLQTIHEVISRHFPAPQSAGPVCPKCGGDELRLTVAESYDHSFEISVTCLKTKCYAIYHPSEWDLADFAQFFRGAPAEPQRWRGVKAELPEEGSEVFAAVWWTTEETSHSSYEVHDCCFWKQGEEWGPKDIFVDCDGTEFDAEEVSFWIYRKDLVAHLPAPKERP